MNSQAQEPGSHKRRYFSNEELKQRYRVSIRKGGLSVYFYDASETNLNTFFSFLKANKQRTIYKLNGDTLLKYFDYLKSNNFRVSTQKYKLKSLKAFYKWLKKEALIEEKEDIFSHGVSIYSHITSLKQGFFPSPAQEKLTQLEQEMQKYIDKFVSFYLQKGYSPQGAPLYRQQLKNFTRYLKENTQVSSIREISKNILCEYQLYLSKLKKKDGLTYAAATLQHKLIAIRSFFKFLLKQDYFEKDPSTAIELPRVDRGLPTAIMSENELEAFLSAPDLSNANGLRDRTIMEVLYSSGMRNDELCHLKIEDVNFEDGLVRISHAKGGVGFQRIVPVGRIACEFIKKYLTYARHKLLKNNPDEQCLFLNNFGTKLKRNVLTKYIAQYRLKTNIRNKITAHSFRVTCATGMLKNSADVRYIQEQLGHRSLRSTQIYTRVFPKDLKRVHSLTHPREKAFKQRP